MLRIATASSFLIFANFLMIDRALAAGEGRVTEPVEIVVPRYEVASDARDPFFAPYKPEEAVVVTATPVSTTPAKVTGEQLVQLLDLTGLVGNDAQKGMAIVNGRLYRIGDNIPVEFQGLGFNLKVVGLNMTAPLGVVVKYGGKEYVVSLNAAEVGDRR